MSVLTKLVAGYGALQEEDAKIANGSLCNMHITAPPSTLNAYASSVRLRHKPNY